MNKLKEIINTVLTNRGRDQISELKPSDSLTNDIGMESIDLAELTVRLEAEYDIDIFEDGIVVTVAEIMDKLSIKE